MKSIHTLTIVIFISLCFATPVRAGDTGPVYYVNAKTGSDGNDGSAKAPWASLQQARRALKGPATVYVYDGDYPFFSETESPHPRGYLHFKAAPHNRPRIFGIEVAYEQPDDAYLIFEGFEIYREVHRKLVRLKYARHVQVLGSVLHGDRWSRGPHSGVVGIDIHRSSDVLFRDNRVYEVHVGVMIRHSDNATVRHNFIKVKGGSGVTYTYSSKNGLIEYNHMTGEDYTPYPEDPLAVNKPHASIIAISSSDLVVRGNFMHGFGSSSGVMMYDEVPAYNNILFESNVLYNSPNNNAFRIYKLGDNIVLRNNLLFSKIRPGACNGHTKDARYRYNIALNVHDIAKGYDGSGLFLYNNIFAGAVLMPEKTTERGNVFWSLAIDRNWKARAPSASSEVITGSYMGCGNQPQVLEDGTIFRNVRSLAFPQRTVLDISLTDQFLRKVTVDRSNLPAYFIDGIDKQGFVREPVPLKDVTYPSVGPVQRTAPMTGATSQLDKPSNGAR
ncbi:right-handed parallel beta-helix repeat-containing protein [Microbulbifer sp. SAOS-129_SWC]|uniref:right-handed parallel beta-helix repeat-containing protein n=1 Tax=Microbulbifer sp. SAOS-129_SWC TaxID=3145235 RepID=UPI003217542D